MANEAAPELPLTDPVAETKPAVETKLATDTKPVEAKAEAKPTADPKPEAKPEAKAEEKAAEDKGSEKKAEEAAAPVDYAKAITEAKIPEGFVLDEAKAKDAAEFFKANNVPADKVQEYIDFYAKQLSATKQAEGQAFAKQVEGWKAHAEKETTPQERAEARTALGKIFDKDDMEILEAFGLTNRASFIKSAAKVGKAIGNDTFVSGNAVTTGARDARSMFPNSNMNP